MTDKVDIHEREQYRVTLEVDGTRVHDKPITDPFVTTTSLIRGWRMAWRCLWGGLRVRFDVSGTREATRVVFTGDYAPEPAPERPSGVLINDDGVAFAQAAPVPRPPRWWRTLRRFARDDEP